MIYIKLNSFDRESSFWKFAAKHNPNMCHLSSICSFFFFSFSYSKVSALKVRCLASSHYCFKFTAHRHHRRHLEWQESIFLLLPSHSFTHSLSLAPLSSSTNLLNSLLAYLRLAAAVAVAAGFAFLLHQKCYCQCYFAILSASF